MNNICFLDIDGPLKTLNFERYINQHLYREYDELGPLVCPIAVANLNIIQQEFNLKYVISSDWAQSGSWGIKEANKFLLTRGLLGKAIGILPPISKELPVRGLRIQHWLKHSVFPYNKFVILDDDIDGIKDYYVNEFAYCDPIDGLSADYMIQDIRMILKS